MSAPTTLPTPIPSIDVAPSQARPETETTPSVPQVGDLDQILQEIRADSTNDPKTYLDQTLIPDGGE